MRQTDLFTQPSFHNSINIEGGALDKAERKAHSLEGIIYAFFTRDPNAEYTPIQVWNLVCPNSLLTSCRRAISNLKRDGFVEKTANKVIEKYGSPNYKFKLKPKTSQP